MLTGQADEEAVERVQSEAHLQHCLRKPWDSQELIEKIRTSLANHE
ncbi:two-component response regulator [Beggiatoa sp. PS]|nr:two-component response regulator [Beggiatoa sp. PS]